MRASAWRGCADATGAWPCRRDHAQIIGEDKELADIFIKWCYMEWQDNNWRDCYSDEHYLGTLLASKVSYCCCSIGIVCPDHMGSPGPLGQHCTSTCQGAQATGGTYQ